MTKHNKKRNIGIVYEQLLTFITANIIADNRNKAKKATKIIERRFKKNTELYKEFRLLNALVNSTVSGTHIAAGIIAEAKNAVRKIDSKKLEKEKSLLIKDINYQLESNNFYHQQIDASFYYFLFVDRRLIEKNIFNFWSNWNWKIKFINQISQED